MKERERDLQAQLERCRQELRASETHFRNIIDRNADGILVVNLDGVVRFANAAAESIFGRRSEDLVGEVFGFPLVFGETTEVDLIHRDGEAITAEMRTTETEWEGERCHLVSLRDITARKRVEDALASKAEELARSNAELQRFAFVASHHLQEPLRTVIGHLQLVERICDDELGAQARQSVRYAVDGAFQMRQMIKDLLKFSEVDKRAGEIGPVNAANVADQALRRLEEMIEESGAEVKRDSLPTVTADAAQLRQVFRHLVENAIKFRDQAQSLRVYISADREGDVWRFSVRDNGIGIDPAYHESIFDLFHRLHTQDLYPGTGIGLAICRKIVERHGGRIWVESKPGEGSTFYFTLPVRETSGII